MASTTTITAAATATAAAAASPTADTATYRHRRPIQDNSSRALEIYDDLLATPGGLNKQVSKVVLTNRAESLSRLGQVSYTLRGLELVW